MTGESAGYSAEVLALFERLPGAGPLPPGGGQAVVGEAVALEQGAWIRFDARVESGRIVDCRFSAWGCPHTLAAAARVAAEVRKLGCVDEAAIDTMRLAKELDAPPEKTGRMLVVGEALAALLERIRAVQ